jgi:hypothetical protein
MGFAQRQISELKAEDLVGESPDCVTREAVPLVLSAIYRTVVGENDKVTIVRFNHLPAILKERG